MLGALASKNNYYYIATDPNTETFYNLYKLGNYINQTNNSKNNFYLYNVGSEILELPKNSVDFAFSCPPFFDLEMYSDENTQSIKKYPNYEDWLNIYVRKTIQNCYQALKENGLFGVDLMNFWTHNKKFNLVDDWVTIAEEEGFYLKGIFPIATRTRKQEEKDKENIYIFVKKKDLFIPNYTNQIILNNYLEIKEENKNKSYRKNHIVIAVYDIWGKLQKTYNTYSDATTAFNLSIEEFNNLILSNKFIKIYHGNDAINPTIKVKTPVCKINNKYYYSLSEAARALRISRQAVSQAKIKQRKEICNHSIEWY